MRDHPATLRELAVMLGQHPKDVEDDVRHLLKSLRNMPYRAEITPARCRKCGFAFQKDKLHKPGKCPRCNGTWITEPMISIEEK